MTISRRSSTVVLGVVLCAACGGHARSDGAAGATNATGGGGGAALGGGGSGGVGGEAGSMGGEAGPPLECPPGLPTAEEIAATPRADTNLEQLAIKLSKRIVADQAIYDRVVRDVGAIRADNPEVAGIDYFAPGDGRGIFLVVDAQAYAMREQAKYQSWTCLTDTYVATDTRVEPQDSSKVYVELTLKGTYDMVAVAKQFEALPGIESASGNSGGDGPSICVTREGGKWVYVFDDAGGDCPSGCNEHAYKWFSTDAAGVVTALGVPTDEQATIYASRQACH